MIVYAPFLVALLAATAGIVATAVGLVLEVEEPPVQRPVGWCQAAARARRGEDPTWLTSVCRPPMTTPCRPLPVRSWVVAAARPADVVIPPAEALPLTARCRWASPTYSTTTQMEAIG